MLRVKPMPADAPETVWRGQGADFCADRRSMIAKPASH